MRRSQTRPLTKPPDPRPGFQYVAVAISASVTPDSTNQSANASSDRLIARKVRVRPPGSRPGRGAHAHHYDLLPTSRPATRSTSTSIPSSAPRRCTDNGAARRGLYRGHSRTCAKATIRHTRRTPRQLGSTGSPAPECADVAGRPAHAHPPARQRDLRAPPHRSTSTSFSTPALVKPRPPPGAYRRRLPVHLPASLTGSPGIAVPYGHDLLGTPMSIQIIGRPWEDPRMLAVARLLAPRALS
jgi:hypothetical protein